MCQFEKLLAEWYAYNCYAKETAKEEIHTGHSKSSCKEPEYVTQEGTNSAFFLDFVSERIKSKACHLESLKSYRDSDNRNAVYTSK